MTFETQPIPYQLTEAGLAALARARRQPEARGTQPVQVRLIGEDAAVRALVAALADAACCGPASYRPARHSAGVRAYLTIVVPDQGVRT